MVLGFGFDVLVGECDLHPGRCHKARTQNEARANRRNFYPDQLCLSLSRRESGLTLMVSNSYRPRLPRLPLMSPVRIDQDYAALTPKLLDRLRADLPDNYTVAVTSAKDSEAGDPNGDTAWGGGDDDWTSWQVAFTCNDCREAFLVGRCPPDQRSLIAALANSTLRELAAKAQYDQTEDCMAQYAVQVTRDFEVLTWMRNLATQFELCDVRNSMEQVADEVLPSLRNILGAASIEYVPPKPSEDEATNSSPARVIDGEIVLTPTQCRRWIQQHQDDPQTVVVLNASGCNDYQAPNVKVRQGMIARLGNDGERFGSIIVINRSVEKLASLSPEDMQLGIDEFGTFDAGLLQSAVTLFMTHGRNLELVRQKDALLVGSIRALIRAIEAKDSYTFGHSDRVALFGKRLASELGLDHAECERIYTTGLLHDIGKIGVPDAVLSKPGRLTEEEFDLIKQHPMNGYKILRDLEQLRFTLGGVLHHHEHYDGTGYPERLAGTDIPLAGRILAVADAYDAMTSDRPYRDGMPTAKAESILRGGAGTQWDPDVVDAMMESIEDIRDIRQSYGRVRAEASCSSTKPATDRLLQIA